MRECGDFDSVKLAAELRVIFSELCRECSEQEAYRYIVNHMISRISEDTGMQLEYSIPEISCRRETLEGLSRTLDRERCDFGAAAGEGLLGEIYESFLDRRTRKRLGLFYTPGHVIGFLLEKTLEGADLVENPYIRVLDPACGSGYFLLQAYDLLRKKFEENEASLVKKYGNSFCRSNIHRHILENCLFGADIDEFGALLTRTALSLKDMEGSGSSPNIAVCDSLVRWEEGANPELASFWGRGFDFIVGNPPWISLSRKHREELPKEKLEYYKMNYTGNSYLPNMYEYFLQRSLELLKEGGSLGFLIPDRFAKNKQFAGFRKRILQDFSLKTIMFGVSMEGVLADSMAIVIGKEALGENVTEVRKAGEIFGNSQKIMLENKDCKFASYPLEGYGQDSEGMENDSVALGLVAESFTGFIGIKEMMTLCRSSKSQSAAVKGEDIGRYGVSGVRYYDISQENVIGGTKLHRKLLAKEKLLVRKTGKRIVAALDRTGLAPEQSLYGLIITSAEFMPEYVLAVLNSKLMEEYYEKFLVTNANSTPQLKKMDLDRIPIKRCSMEKQREIAEIVERLADNYDPLLQEQVDRFIFAIYRE